MSDNAQEELDQDERLEQEGADGNLGGEPLEDEDAAPMPEPGESAGEAQDSEDRKSVV